jgi:hypothetical protein
MVGSAEIRRATSPSANPISRFSVLSEGERSQDLRTISRVRVFDEVEVNTNTGVTPQQEI